LQKSLEKNFKIYYNVGVISRKMNFFEVSSFKNDRISKGKENEKVSGPLERRTEKAV
jgi:hypothetical protein